MRGPLRDTKTNDQRAAECEEKIGEAKGADRIRLLSKSIIHC